MNIRQLEIFLAVCETLSITETAKRLYLSQPAISKVIRELEISIGVLFFDRINGKLHLNEEGKAFRIKADQLIQDFERLRNFNRNYDFEVPLRIGISLTIATNSLPYAVEQFKTKYPNTPLKIYSENVRQIQKRLLNGEIDIALIEGFESNLSFDTEIISEYNLFLVCVNNDKFLKGETINRDNFFNLPFLLREKGSTLRDCFDELTHKLHIEVSPLLESINTEVLIRAASAGMGITVLPEPFAIDYLNKGILKRLSLENHKMATVNYAVILKGKFKNKKINDIIEYFKAAESEYGIKEI